MRAITVTPGAPGRERLAQLDEPDRGQDELLVEMLALGVCGTDREIVGGQYGWAPPGRDWLVLGHESLGRVREDPVLGYKYVVLGHNTIRGAAGAAVLNAELMQSEGLLGE